MPSRRARYSGNDSKSQSTPDNAPGYPRGESGFATGVPRGVYDKYGQLLREYLGALEAIEIAGECANGFEAVRSIGELAPDVVFLDVQMPKLDGFEVLELLDRTVAVVFVTAFDEHAIRAFEVHAVDYLLKPVAEERLARALTRVRERGAGIEISATRLGADAKPVGSAAHLRTVSWVTGMAGRHPR